MGESQCCPQGGRSSSLGDYTKQFLACYKVLVELEHQGKHGALLPELSTMNFVLTRPAHNWSWLFS